VVVVLRAVLTSANHTMALQEGVGAQRAMEVAALKGEEAVQASRLGEPAASGCCLTSESARQARVA
jgi:hypothetical protein